jgi:antitoxin (DNA-binding transcriptional repressor) of toxin-antitoxin stability system
MADDVDVPVAEFRRTLRTWMDRVARGQTVTVLRAGIPVAIVHQPEENDDDDDR